MLIITDVRSNLQIFYTHTHKNSLDNHMKGGYNNNVERTEKGDFSMKKFVISYVVPNLFGQGFYRSTREVWGAVNAHRVLREVRAMRNAPVIVWVTCE